MTASADEPRFVSRGGQKLAAALRQFEISVAGLICADFGSHVGGFVDCLLRQGAAKVYAVEPGYGVLDYRLRKDARVVVMERKNALHATCPERVQFLSIDVGWTPQRLILPAAKAWLRGDARIVSLVKPHYEADKSLLRGGVLPVEHLASVLERVRAEIREAGFEICGEIDSPIAGHGGNHEYLWLLHQHVAQASRL